MTVLSIARMSCRRRAAIAALAPPLGQLDTPYWWLALCRSWEPRGRVKREGKIKGPARARPQSQSARGLGAARRLVACVPRRNTNPHGIVLGCVPSLMRFAALRWSLCHGLA